MAQIILWNSYCGSDNRGGLSKDLLRKDNWNIADFSTVRPLGAHQMASWLRENGYSVAVIDFCDKMTTQQLVDVTSRYIQNNTIAIGVSTTFWPGDTEPFWILEARSAVENLYSNIKWMLGGSRDTDAKRLSWIEFSSYAEDNVLSFLNKNDNFTKFDIKTSVIHYTDRDFIRPHEVLSFELGRGCQFKCKFCRFPLLGKKRGTYIKNMHLVKDQLIEIYERFGVTRYNFIDDTVNEDEEKIENLARLAQSLPFKLEWIGFCRADLIWARPNTIKLLTESGLVSTFFGIESFEPNASKLVGKGWSGKHAKEFLLKLKDEWGDRVTMNLGLIVGIPGESLNSLDEHNEWLIHNDIGKWRWAPLFVTNKNQNSIWLSEFDKNYEKYGLKFSEQNSINWHHDQCNYQQAIDKSVQLQTRAFNSLKNCGFTLSDYCTTLGTDFKTSMHLRWAELFSDESRTEIYNSMKRNVDNYVVNHLS